MKDIRTLHGKIEYGHWSGHLPSKPRSYLVMNATYEVMRKALEQGHTIRVGNSPKRVKGLLSRVNSRYHGFTIRTIHVID
jgi:hypothetical protein